MKERNHETLSSVLLWKIILSIGILFRPLLKVVVKAVKNGLSKHGEEKLGRII